MKVCTDRNSNIYSRMQTLHALHIIAFTAAILVSLANTVGCAPKLRNQANLERLINALTADVTPPTILQFGAPTVPVAGGSKVQIPVLATDQVGIAKYQLSYSKDGSQFSDVSEALPDSTSISWSVPSVDLDSAVLKLTVFDYAGNKSSETSKSIRIDSTPPDAPSMTLTSSVSTNSSLVTFTADDCEDTAFLLVSESSTQPAASDSAWQSCSTTASGINHTLTADGSHSLRVWAKDEAGNISLSASSASSVFLDSTGPVLSFSTAPTILTTLKGGVSYTFNFSASDALSSVSSLKLQYAVNSSSFVDVATLATSATSYSWTVPTDNTFGAVIRLLASDSKGNASVLDTAAFTIDSTAPSVSLTSPSGTYRGGDTLNLTLSSSDAGVGLASLTLQYAADGTTFGSDISLPVSSTSYSWSIPTATNVATAKLKLIAIDNVGNSQSVTSSAFTIDSTASAVPAVSLNSSSPTNSTSATFTVSDCTDRAKIFVSEGTTTPAYNAAGWSSCSTSAGAIAFTLSSGDATKAVHFWSQDSVGNVSTTYATVNVILDTTSPTLSLTSLSGGQFIPGGQNYSITWTAADANFGATPIKIEVSSNSGSSWSDIIAATANTGSYTWAVPGSTNSTTYRIRITATDAAGNSSTPSSSSSDFTIDSDAPSVTALSITEGASTTSNSIRVNLTASDPYTKITQFCVKYNTTTTPSLTDACWIAVNNPLPGVTPSLNINFSDFYYTIGFTQGTYDVYGWVRDQAGNISPLSASGVGTDTVDKATINYQPGTPPSITSVAAHSTDTPSNPPTSNDMSTPSGSTIFIKWKATDDQPLPANPISIYYTQDNINYTLIASNISNSANSGCTITGVETGCYQWINGSPTNGYLSIRVAVQDSNSMVSYTTAPALNVMPPIRFLAGNTEPGLNGSATSAMFFNAISDGNTDAGTLLIHPNGTVYFRDINRGILIVSPNDGIQKLLIPTTGTSSGDGGPISSATLRYPAKIALDYQNRILVFDYNRIRRIDTTVSPMTIDTIIGGGGSTADTVAPLSLQMTTNSGYPGYGSAMYMPLVPLPNGDIYFQSENYNQGKIPGTGIRMRVYKQSLNQVQSIYFTGTGDSYNASQDITYCPMTGLGLAFNPVNSAITHLQATFMHSLTDSNCLGTSNPGPGVSVQFNPTTGISLTPHPTYSSMNYVAVRVTGRDGELYTVSRKSPWIGKFDRTALTWTPIVGTGTLGNCNDGTLATSCNIDPQDLFVTAQGQIYFMDKGRIRTLDSAGKVITLLGQSYYFGDGGPALSARFNTINFIDQKTTGEIALLDQLEFRFREFTIGGNISTIAGNGNNSTADTSTPANSQSMVMNYAKDDFRMDPTTGDIFYYRAYNRISKLNRATGLWQDLVGAGATSFITGDGLTGNNLKLNSAVTNEPRVLGFDGTSILVNVGTRDANATPTDSFFKTYTINNGTQSHLAGQAGSVGSLCANGTATSNCLLPGNGSSYSSATFDSVGNRWLIHQVGSVLIRSFPYGGNVGTLISLPTAPTAFAYRRTGGTPAEIVYYCSSVDGKLHKNDFSTDTTLAWPITSVSCTGKRIIYNSSTNSIIFIYIQNGLMGIAEYLNP